MGLLSRKKRWDLKQAKKIDSNLGATAWRWGFFLELSCMMTTITDFFFFPGHTKDFKLFEDH